MIEVKEITEIFGKHKGERCLIVGSGPSLDNLQADFWRSYDFIICSNLVLYTPCDYLIRPDDFGHNVLSIIDGCFYHYFRIRMAEDGWENAECGRLVGHGDTIGTAVSLAHRLGAKFVAMAGCDFTFEGYAKRRYKQRPETPVKMTDRAWKQLRQAKEGIDRQFEAYGLEHEYLV